MTHKDYRRQIITNNCLYTNKDISPVLIEVLKKLNLLPIATALKLFTIKVAPIATYGIQLIWNHLKYSNLE